jgi:Ca2+-binding EF-hand superfamily protein
MKRTILCVAILTVIGAAGLRAEDKPAAKAGKADGAAQMQQKMLQQFDANKDGVLSDQEKLAAAEMMRRMGAVGGIEPGGFPGADQFAKQFDKDGDGKLNDAEKLMAQAAWQRMRNKNSGPAYGMGYGGQAGAGGYVPNTAGNAASGEAKAPKVSSLVKRFDKDGDGKLNDEEKAAAQAELNKNKKGKDAKPKADKPEKPAADKPE